MMLDAWRRLAVLALIGGLALVAGCFDGDDDDGMPPSAATTVTETPASASSPTSTPAGTQTATPEATGTPALAPEPGTFGQTGPPVTARSLHTATLLEDGRVLIAGGANLDLGVLDSTELYDPEATTVATQGPYDDEPPRTLTGAFEETGLLSQARQTHAATRLADGRVLITGGVAPGGAHLDSAEIFDPATGEFTSAGEMSVGRLAHGSILLDDGRVLIVGGFGNPYLASTEIYDQAAGTFSPSGEMRFGRQFPSLVRLADGRVLVHGGAFEERVAPEVYDPATGTFTLLETPPGFEWPSQATGLLDGTVLLTGLCCGEDGVSALDTAAILDPVSGEVEEIDPMHEGRFGHATVLLADGRVLLAGGWAAAQEGAEALASAEVYDPATRSFELVAPMSDGRNWHTATLVPDGRVLTLGEPGHPYERAVEVFIAPPREIRSIGGLFVEPRDTEPDAVQELAPRPPSPFAEWNDEDVVLYDIEEMTELNLGPGGFARFSPDGTRLAWAAGELGRWDELWVLNLATGERRRIGPGRSLRWVDDETLVFHPPGVSNTEELVDVATGERRPANGINLNPVFGPTEAAGWRLDRIARGEYPLWSSTYELTDVRGTHLPLRFDALEAVLAPDGMLFVALSPEETSGAPEEGPHVEIGLSNIFAVDPESGEATYLATALATAPSFPFVATETVVAWTDDACGRTDETHGMLVYDRRSGVITEVLPRQWIVSADGDVIGLDVFGPKTLIDARTFMYLAVLSENLIDVSWTRDLRYAAVGGALGHGGPCG